jgi:hypothetical protein
MSDSKGVHRDALGLADTAKRLTSGRVTSTVGDASFATLSECRAAGRLELDGRLCSAPVRDREARLALALEELSGVELVRLPADVLRGRQR